MTSPPALVASPVAQQPPPPWCLHRGRRLAPRPTCASRSSSVLARRASEPSRAQPQPRVVAAQWHPPTPPAAVRRDAQTGLALLLVVLAAVMSCSLSLTILSFSARRALHKLVTAANKVARVVAEEAPGTLSSLKLSFMEINDLTSQLKNLRKRLTMSRYGKEDTIKASSRTGWPKQGNT